MSDLYCKCVDITGSSYYEILAFITTPAGYVEAICKDRFGNLSSEPISNLKIIDEGVYQKMRT